MGLKTLPAFNDGEVEVRPKKSDAIRSEADLVRLFIQHPEVFERVKEAVPPTKLPMVCLSCDETFVARRKADGEFSMYCRSCTAHLAREGLRP